uniref:Uncharacterized protein n=1 Tax=Gopherus agassizii TaxID=38772 RepID=A0A452GWH7_9SAUR
MEVQKEAQRIMTLSVWKMYNSRLQRGGLRLHRSLQLSLVMRSAREVYLSAKLEEDEEGRLGPQPGPGEEGAGQTPLQPAESDSFHWSSQRPPPFLPPPESWPLYPFVISPLCPPSLLGDPTQGDKYQIM